MRAIFISYRRDDSEGHAGRLYDDLVQQFGDGSVFMDVAGIEPGIDFRKVIDKNVSSCGVLLALIGPAWLDAKDEEGHRRLDNPMDFVRLETAAALKREIPVVPVLVSKARMPRPEQLPDDLKELAYRNGVELTHPRWDTDVQALVKALRRHIDTLPEGVASGMRIDRVQDRVVENTTPPDKTDGASPPPPDGPRTSNKSQRLIVGVTGAIILVIAVGVLFYVRSTSTSKVASRQGQFVVPDPGIDLPTADFPSGSKRIYSAAFNEWPTIDSQYGSIKLGFGNTYVMKPASNTWIGPGRPIDIPQLQGDFVLDVRFRIAEKNPSASLNLTLEVSGDDADRVDAYFDLWSDEKASYTLNKSKVKRAGLAVPHVVTEEMIAERVALPASMAAHQWFSGGKITLRREGGKMAFFVNDEFVKEFTISLVPFNELGLGVAFPSTVEITSIEARTKL